jgi:hypothetical protein
VICSTWRVKHIRRVTITYQLLQRQLEIAADVVAQAPETETWKKGIGDENGEEKHTVTM